MGRPLSPPSDAAIARIQRAASAKSAAEDEFVDAVVDAIRNEGGSLRTVADIAGISRATVQRWLAQ